MKRDGESLADTVATDAGQPGSRGLESPLTSASELASANTVAPPSTSRPIPAQPDVLPEVDPSVYVQLDEFARGGLGRIIRAKDTRTGRTVAIKEMLTSNADAAARFVREALVTSNLQHPAIVPVYEVGRWASSGQPFYAMKLVKGRPLDQAIAANAGLDQRLGLLHHVVAVADALAYAHGEHVIHRDLKPHNVLCGGHGETVVIDWGLARRLEEQDPSTSMPRITSAPPGATYAGAIMGTPGYMPPEQAWGERVDERADVYSIGAILYHLLAGAPPFAGKDLQDVLDKVRSEAPRSVREIEPRVPPDLATIVERAMAREAKNRYPSAAELAGDLRRFTEGQLVLAHHYTTGQRVRRFIRRYRALLALAAIALGVVAIVGVLAIRNVITARDVAERERGRADDNALRAQQHLVNAHIDRARTELVSERADSALAFALAAARAGDGTFDDEVRFIVARATERLPPVRRRSISNIGSMLFVPGSHDLVISDEHGVVRWDPDADVERWHEPTNTGELWVLDGRRVLAGRRDDLAMLDLETGKLLGRFGPSGNEKFIGYVGTDRAHRWLAAPTRSHVEIFDLSTQQRVASIPVASVDNIPLLDGDGMKAVLTVPFSDIARQLVLTDRAGKLTVLCTNCVRRTWAGNEVVFATVAEAGRPPRISVVDWNGKPRLDLGLETTSDVLDLATDPEHGLLALGFMDGAIEVRDLRTGKLIWRATIRDRVSHVLFDRRGRLWALGASNGTVAFDARSGVELVRWSFGGAWLDVSGDHDWLAVLQPKTGVVAWPIGAPPVRALAPTAARVRRLAFLSGDAIATASEDGAIAVFDAAGVPHILGKHAASATDVVALPGGRVLSTSRDGTSVAWDLGAGKLFEIPAGFRIAVAADGMIATAKLDGTVALWNADGSAARELGRLGKEPMAVRWSPDGARVAAIDVGGEVKIWERGGRQLRVLPPSKAGVDVTFSPDGRYLVRADVGPKMMYAVDGGSDRRLVMHAIDPQTYSVRFTADGSRVLMVGDGFATVWDAATGEVLTNVSTTSDMVAGAFILGDRLMVGAGTDRKVHVWNVGTGAEVAVVDAPDEVYFLTTDRGDRLGVATTGPALVWQLSKFAGDLSALEAIVGCRSELVVDQGATHRRDIDFARCNRFHAGR